MLQVQAKSIRQIAIPHTAGTLSRAGRANAIMAVHAAMQKMMPKFTESSTETSVVAIHTTKAAAAYLAAHLALLRESVHIQPAINKNTQLMLARQMS